MALEDEEWPILQERLPQAINLAHQLARYGGLMNILIQPDILGHKLQFEREFIAGVQHFAWFGTLREYAAWWTARNEVSVDTEVTGDSARVTLTAPQPLNGLPLQIPAGWKLQAVEPAGLQTTQAGSTVVIEQVPLRVRLHFQR